MHEPTIIYTRGQIAEMAGVKQHEVENVIRLRHIPHQYVCGKAAGYRGDVAIAIAKLVKIHQPRHALPTLHRTYRFVQDELRRADLDPVIREGYLKDTCDTRAKVLKTYMDNIYVLIAGEVADLDAAGFLELEAMGVVEKDYGHGR